MKRSVRIAKQLIIMMSMCMYTLISLADDDDGYIPLSTNTQAAASETISTYLIAVIQNDIVPIVSICASFFCLYKSLTGVFASYSAYQRDKDSAAFKESLISSFIFLGISASIIYYLTIHMVAT